MANLVEWVLEAAGGEDIESVVIGEMGRNKTLDILGRLVLNPCPGKLLSWEEAIALIDYEFDDGLGGSVNCNAIYVWTKSLVLFISEYDGSTSICSVPRHPVPVMPVMPG